MGVGKTTVCQQLKQDLQNSVFIDGDWCWDASPFQVTDEICDIIIRTTYCETVASNIFSMERLFSDSAVPKSPGQKQILFRYLFYIIPITCYYSVNSIFC